MTFSNQDRIQGTPILRDANHVATRFKHIRDDFSWIFSNIYAPNSKTARRNFWKKHESFRSCFPNENWVIMGDFNTPLLESEKFGGSQI